MAAELAWYTTVRAETLATIYLTRHDDLDVIPESRFSRNARFDLRVMVIDTDAPDDTAFAVETKGVHHAVVPKRNRFRIRYETNLIHPSDLPICVFLFDVDTEEGYYLWLFEPVLSGDHVRLRPHPAFANLRAPSNGRFIVLAEFARLDDAAIDEIVRRVKEWYRAKWRLGSQTVVAGHLFVNDEGSQDASRRQSSPE